ncbi:hypothetical protein HZB89_01275 [archaeon]|nr:hypothetical protein [archaeon]
MKSMIPSGSAAFIKALKGQSVKITTVSGGQTASFIAVQPATGNFVGQETVRDNLIHSSLKFIKDNEQNFFGVIGKPSFFLDAFGSKAFEVIGFSKNASQLDLSLPGCSHRIYEDARLGCRDLLLGALIAGLSEDELIEWLPSQGLVDNALQLKKELRQGIVSGRDLKLALMILFRRDYVDALNQLSTPRIIPSTINFFMKTGLDRKGKHLTFTTQLPQNSFVELKALQDFFIGVASCPGGKPSNPKPSGIIVEVK